ncbi:MAG: DUF2628 domain-containing protein [Actinomycetota bacterium]
MTIFSVYEPSESQPDVEARADSLAFVKEGFSWPAFLVPALWLIYCRMWIEFIVFIAILALVQLISGGGQEAGAQLAGWVTIAMSVILGFEGNDLRAAALERRGYRLIGIAEGRGRTDAELSFFKTWLPVQRKQPRPERGPERPVEHQRDSEAKRPTTLGEGEGVIGLFPQA